MARHISVRQAHTFLVLALCATPWLQGCGTGATFVEGQNPFAAGGSGVTTPATGTQAGSGNSTVPSAGDGNSTDGDGVDPGSGGTVPAGTASVGVEIDTKGAAVDTAYWSGALQAVGALRPGAPLSARLVVARYSGGQVRLAYSDDGSSALPSSRTSFEGDNGTEALLTALDGMGAAVVLELQPGTVALTTLAQEVLAHFRPHPSVVGVSINLTQYGTTTLNVGSKSLSNSDASALVKAAQGVLSTAVVHLRSYTRTLMPTSARTGLVFVLDAAGFDDLADMKGDYGTWAGRYASASVQFVTAADQDTSWSCKLAGGPADLLTASLAAAGNVSGVQWSASSIAKLYPSNTFSCLSPM